MKPDEEKIIVNTQQKKHNKISRISSEYVLSDSSDSSSVCSSKKSNISDTDSERTIYGEYTGISYYELHELHQLQNFIKNANDERGGNPLVFKALMRAACYPPSQY
jgi:hypothetical protein